MKQYFHFFLAIVAAICVSISFSSCGDDSGDDVQKGGRGSLTYTYYGTTYHLEDYFESFISRSPSNWYYKGRQIKWQMELFGVTDRGADGNTLDFNIYTDNVKAGFEFTNDNFSVDMAMPLSYEDIEYTKKSGSGKITKMTSESAEVEFKNFIMKGDKENAPDIVVNGKATIDVD